MERRQGYLTEGGGLPPFFKRGQKMNENNANRFFKALVPIVLALVSIFLITQVAASPEFHAGTIASLDAKNKTVLELAAASTATSAAITLLPGDAATPIADKLAELSSYFLIVISAIYLEKYLTTITGYATFMILIPAACVLLSINVFARRPMLKRIAVKLMIFGIAVALVIPASVKVSDMIDDTYNASIQATIDSAMAVTQELEAGEDASSGLGISGVLGGVRSSISSAADKVKSALNNFIEALAVMIVTSCLIPILVILFILYLLKILLGSDADWMRMPPPGRPHGMNREGREE